MPHLVTSAQAEDHVNSYNDRHYNAGTYGPGQYVLASGNNLAATMVDSNTLRILDGAGLVNGAFWEIEGAFEELVIENGTPGYNRIDLVVAHIETAPQETIELRVLKGEETTGEPVMPAHIEGDLNNGDTVVEQPLHAVTLDGINPGEPVPQFEVTPSFAEFRDSLSQREERSHFSGNLAPRGYLNTYLPKIDGYHIVSCYCELTTTGACVVAVTNPILMGDGRYLTRIINANDVAGLAEGCLIGIYQRD